jgi:predicted dehydrogenase|eukprot:COSAG01_NODE_2848_length_6979_cov_12.425000_4_plen_342_part_00
MPLWEQDDAGNCGAACRRLATLSTHLVSAPASAASAAAASKASAAGGSAPVAGAAGRSSVVVALLTERHADHLGGFLGGLAAAATGVHAIATADITGGARFGLVQQHLPPQTTAAHQMCCYYYTDPAALLSAHRPILTVVTAEPKNSVALARSALMAGSHVLLEKPGCRSLQEIEDLCDVAEQQGLQLMLAMATRVNPAIVETKRLIAQGYLGKPLSATLDWVADTTRLARPQQLYPDAEKPSELAWAYRRDGSPGGKLIYHGIHYIDALQWLLGDTISAVAALTANVGSSKIETEDSAVLSFRMQCGLQGECTLLSSCMMHGAVVQRRSQKLRRRCVKVP